MVPTLEYGLSGLAPLYSILEQDTMHVAPIEPQFLYPGV